MDEIRPIESLTAEQFGALILTEKLRRAVRKHPDSQILRSALHDAGELMLLPKEQRMAQRDRLLTILESSRTHNP